MGKFVVFCSILFAALLGGSAYAIFPQDTAMQTLLTRANRVDPLPGIGDIINRTKNMMRVTYDASSMALTGSVSLLDDQGQVAYLPKGAIVTNVVANVLTQPLPSTSSVNLTMLTGADLMANKAQSAMGLGFVAGVPVGTAATWVGPVTSNMGTNPLMVIMATGSNLTAGKIQWFIEYVIQ